MILGLGAKTKATAEAKAKQVLLLCGRMKTRRCGALGAGAQPGQEGLGGGRGVDDVFGSEPGAAELDDAEVHVIELFSGVGVGVDDDLAAEGSGEAHVGVGEISAGGGGVVFDGDAYFGGTLEDLSFRPVGWARTRTYGFERAIRTRAVWSGSGRSKRV